MIKRFWIWLRFGEITEVIKSIDGGHVLEVEFLGRGGKRIGYWAYGYYDPIYPYQGNEAK